MTAQARTGGADGLGLTLVLLSAVAFSTAGLFTRFIPLDAWTTLFWRGLFGGLVCLACVVWREGRGTMRTFRGIGGAGLAFCLLSATGMVAFLGALKTTTVAHVAILYAPAPLVAAGLAYLVLGERISRATLLASLAALAGVGLTVGAGLGEGSPLGDVLAMVMTLACAGLIVAARAGGGAPMMPAACLSAFLGAAVAAPWAQPLAAGAGDLMGLALFGAVTMGLGLMGLAAGASRLPAAQTALIGVLDTPLAPLWVWLAFGETPRASTLAGGALVSAAVLAHAVRDGGRG